MSDPETLEDVAGQISPHITEGRRSCRNTRSPWTISPGLEGASPARETPKLAAAPPKLPAVASVSPARPRRASAPWVIGSYDELVAAVRERVDELGMVREEMDRLAGLPDRYTAKILGPRQVKGFGRASLGPILGAIGCRLILVEDIAQTEKIRAQMTPRQRPVRTSSMPIVDT
jgi:hypothetical protein